MKQLLCLKKLKTLAKPNDCAKFVIQNQNKEIKNASNCTSIASSS